MESVVIACESNREREFLLRVPPDVAVRALDPLRRVLERGDCRAYLDRQVQVTDALDGEDVDRGEMTIKQPIVYTLSFIDIEFCKELLVAMVNDPGIMIDNDHGLQMPGDKFVQRVLASPAWDWRQW